MITFRVDDYPRTKDDEDWRHNLENFKEFDRVMTRYVDGYVLGVIPTKLSVPEWEYLRDNGHIEVALHGIDHDERYPNEFRPWQTSAERRRTLQSWKEALEDRVRRPVTKYIPPHNVVDEPTVLALKEAGFDTVWGGPETDEKVVNFARVRSVATATFLPPYFYGRSDEMLDRGAVVVINDEVEKWGHAYVGLHWTWERNIGLENLDLFLSQLRCKG